MIKVNDVASKTKVISQDYDVQWNGKDWEESHCALPQVVIPEFAWMDWEI